MEVRVSKDFSDFLIYYQVSEYLENLSFEIVT